jgi:hypothetical protein
MKLQRELYPGARRHWSRLRASALSLFIVVVATNASFCRAAIIIDDDFTGTAGGIPPGWTRATIGFNDAYDDSGATTVALHTATGGMEGRAMIFNDAAFDPSNGLTWTVDVTSLDNLYLQTGIAEDLGAGNYFGIRFHRSGLLEAFANRGSVDFEALGTITGYSGGEVALTIRVDPSGYRVSTNTGFDSGAKPWSTLSNGYTLETQNDPSHLWIQIDGSRVPNAGVFDRVRLETVPEPASLWFPLLGILIAATHLSHRRRIRAN